MSVNPPVPVGVGRRPWGGCGCCRRRSIFLITVHHTGHCRGQWLSSCPPPHPATVMTVGVMVVTGYDTAPSHPGQPLMGEANPLLGDQGQRGVLGRETGRRAGGWPRWVHQAPVRLHAEVQSHFQRDGISEVQLLRWYWDGYWVVIGTSLLTKDNGRMPDQCLNLKQ